MAAAARSSDPNFPQSADCPILASLEQELNEEVVVLRLL